MINAASADQDADDVDNNNQTRTTTNTHISNPGIAERLEKDISGFEKYGFSFHREDDGNGIFESSQSMEISAACLQLHVSDVALLASIGPYLRTLVRLCVDPIDPKSLHATVVIAECKKNKDNVTRSIAHAIHMLIRNSMGAALFLDLHVVLPPGEKSSREQVLNQMKLNDDGCYEYPSVALHDAAADDDDERPLLQTKEPFSIDLGLVQESKGAPPSIRNPLARNSLQGFHPERQYLDLKVSTRMCTVRLTPLLYNLSQVLLLRGNEDVDAAGSSSIIQSSLQSPVIVMVCLEKISNLYRVLMLVRDYGGLDAIEKQLVVVCRTDAVQRFQAEAKAFISKNFCKPTTEERICFPRVLSVEDAKEFLVHDILPRATVIGFDLHENAVTLSESDDAATNMLQSSGAVILGYESDGIPASIDAVVSQYVQIESRTSINVVAAFSIVLHTVMN